MYSPCNGSAYTRVYTVVRFLSLKQHFTPLWRMCKQIWKSILLGPVDLSFYTHIYLHSNTSMTHFAREYSLDNVNKPVEIFDFRSEEWLKTKLPNLCFPFKHQKSVCLGIFSIFYIYPFLFLNQLKKTRLAKGSVTVRLRNWLGRIVVKTPIPLKTSQNRLWASLVLGKKAS